MGTASQVEELPWGSAVFEFRGGKRAKYGMAHMQDEH